MFKCREFILTKNYKPNKTPFRLFVIVLFYLKLQYKRIYRIINDLGMPPYLGMVLIIFAFLKLSNLLFSKIEFAPLVYSLIVFFFIFSFGNTERNTFLKTVFSKKDFQKVRLIENLLIAIPFSLFLCYKLEFLYSLLVIVFSGVLSFFNTNKKLNLVIPTPFYKKPFEFIIGFRRFFLVIFITYALTIIAVNVKNFNLGIFTLCVLGILLPEFYKKTEPKTFVWTHSLTPKEFLKNKVITALILGFYLCLPIHLALWFTFPEKFYITIIFQVIIFCFLIACIYGKYKHFPKQMLVTTGIIIGVCLLFPPLFAVVIPYIYNEALTNLRKLL